jgi:hypothetical protein
MFQHSPPTTTPKPIHPAGSPARKASFRWKACNHNVHYQHQRIVCKRAVPLVRTSFTACNLDSIKLFAESGGAPDFPAAVTVAERRGLSDVRVRPAAPTAAASSGVEAEEYGVGRVTGAFGALVSPANQSMPRSAASHVEADMGRCVT